VFLKLTEGPEDPQNGKQNKVNSRIHEFHMRKINGEDVEWDANSCLVKKAQPKL
jgi:hypothetical protein